jgi:parallel beta-helix repeat protein
MRVSLLLAFSCLGYAHSVWATVYELSPDDNWFAVIGGDGLQPGDDVVLTGGVYRDARRLVIGHRGMPEQPVVIRAADGARAVLHRPDARQNTINIVGAQYLVLRGLEITGGSTGIRMMKSDRHPCKFVTIEGLHIHHVGGPAVTANSPGNAYEGLVFRRNHIHHTAGHGEGFYLGSNNQPDGSTAGYMFDSLVEGNYIHDLNGPGISQGDGIEIKDGSYNNIVRDNVIHDTNYPGVIVYGTDGNPPNIVERNAIWNSGDHGIQAAAEAIVRNNLVVGSRADGIHSHTHQSARVGGLQILHNTVLGSRLGTSAIRISLSDRETLAGSVLIANNALYAAAEGFALRLPEREDLEASITIAGNVGSGATEGLPQNAARAMWNSSGQLVRDLDDHYFPRTGSALIGAASAPFLVNDDFNGTARQSPSDSGAYVFHPEGNPGWAIAPGFKPQVKPVQ